MEAWYLHMQFTMTRLQRQPHAAMTFTGHMLHGQSLFLRRDGHAKWQSGKVVKVMSMEIFESFWGG